MRVPRVLRVTRVRLAGVRVLRHRLFRQGDERLGGRANREHQAQGGERHQEGFADHGDFLSGSFGSEDVDLFA
jgi:hypothetical protein